jgi:hypothetical protein
MPLMSKIYWKDADIAASKKYAIEIILSLIHPKVPSTFPLSESGRILSILMKS